MTKSDWKKCKLGEVADITSSKRIFLADYVQEGIPFYRSKEIIEKANNKDISNPLFISEEKYLQIVNKFGAPVDGDLLLTSVGTLGIPYRVRKDDKFYFKDGNLTWFRRLTNVSCDYLYYFFLSPIGKEKLEQITIGSTQKALTINALQNIDICLPPVEEQKRIAQILGALDDKIELLQKQNKTLEDMAKAIFKSWFVDFDVVHAKANLAKRRRSPTETLGDDTLLTKADIMCEYHLTDELYDLFPSDFENSSLGPIPLGWQATTFKTITTQEKTRVGSQELPVLSAVKTGELVLSEDFFNKQVFSNSIKNYIVVPRLSFAYNPSRINIGSIGCNHMNSAGCVSPVYVVFSVISGYENYMEFIIHSTSFNSEVAHRASGTVRQSLSYQDLSYIPVIKPSKDIISMFDTLISYWQQKQILNNKQMQTLTELRDTLLPPLISGKIRV